MVVLLRGPSIMSTGLRRILCIDDDEDILILAQMSLESVGGFDVKICTNAIDAIDIAQEFLPDYILIDYMMPNMDGPAALEAFRSIPALENTPVAFMTARAAPEEVESYLAIGANAVIAKPFDPMNLAEQVRASWQAARSDGAHRAAS